MYKHLAKERIAKLIKVNIGKQTSKNSLNRLDLTQRVTGLIASLKEVNSIKHKYDFAYLCFCTYSVNGALNLVISGNPINLI